MRRTAVAAALLLAACGTETDDVAVSGTVPEEKVEYRPLSINKSVRSILATTTTTTTTVVSRSRPGKVTRPPTTPLPSPAVYSSGVEQWREKVAVYFPGEVDRVLRVMHCESKGNPNATNTNSNGTTDHGLMQINSHWYHPEGHSDPVSQYITANWHLRYDPDVNLEMARRIRVKYGWGQWACR